MGPIWALHAAGKGWIGRRRSRWEPQIRRTARALVLTEWTVVRLEGELAAKAAEARQQAEISAGGALADVELKRTRYVVLVCKDDLSPPADVVMNGITYKHVVIATAPRRPSDEARRRVRPGQP